MTTSRVSLVATGLCLRRGQAEAEVLEAARQNALKNERLAGQGLRMLCRSVFGVCYQLAGSV